ncbi:MAG TPA: nuclear transport factor 2 family protein [Alphaproteobacteria bacterium]|nr:nuclear transport factor 2 family protein [Alphaproteobacteria bacterium]
MNQTPRYFVRPAFGAAFFIAAACLFIGAPATAATNGKQAVLAANAGFYAALNTLFTGDSAAMEAVWSHADDVTYMGPTGGFEHGWAAVLKNWQGQAALKLGGKVEPAQMQVIVGKDLAIVTEYEEGENTNANGKVERLKLRGTNIFRRESGEWKMVGHQTDTLPYLAK